MQDTPDLSRIVSLIMENPALVEQISALAANSSETDAQAEVGNSAPEEAAPAATEPVYTATHGESNRSRLLCAMKPYLSKERAKAIDSMLAIADVFDMMRSR